tara:strand:+ start:2775 stop:3677 length:903 start_codon:yes stop_codon:yes gene_type:complete
MAISTNPVGYILDAIQTYFDAVVAPSGGDYTTIQAADDVLDAGNYTLLVKTGTYAGFTVSTDKVHIVLGPGTVITSAITLSGDDITLELMPGCDIQAVITMSGANVHVICRNACDLDGVVMSGNFGYFNGGGWDTLVDGTTANHAISITGTDCIVENVAVQTTAGGGQSFHGVSLAGARDGAVAVKVIDSDSVGVITTGADALVEGCVILGADGENINLGGLRGRAFGNYGIAAGGNGLAIAAGGDDTVVVGNILKDSAAGVVDIAAAGENCVVVGNRLDGAVTDNSGTSTVADNDVTAF